MASMNTVLSKEILAVVRTALEKGKAGEDLKIAVIIAIAYTMSYEQRNALMVAADVENLF